MCQLSPYTLPCCRKLYVEVKRLPSCSDCWPKLKCPPELCIQLGGYQPETADHREVGECWRCQAKALGRFGRDFEAMRPAIDSAVLAQGLEEFDSSDRRRTKEAIGDCWFCGASEECRQCRPHTGFPGDKYNGLTKRKAEGRDQATGNRLNKRSRAVGFCNTPAPRSSPRTPRFTSVSGQQQSYPFGTGAYSSPKRSAPRFTSSSGGTYAYPKSPLSGQSDSKGASNSNDKCAETSPTSRLPGHGHDPYEGSDQRYTHESPTDEQDSPPGKFAWNHQLGEHGYSNDHEYLGHVDQMMSVEDIGCLMDVPGTRPLGFR